MMCRSLGKIDVVQIEGFAKNRVSSFKNGDTTAVREFDLTIDTYVLNTDDDFELEIGQMMLKEIAKSDFDADGRYRFLLGASYLNSSCNEHQNEVLRTLSESASERNLLAAALLPYLYKEGYQCFTPDPVRYHVLLKSYEDVADSKVNFEDAIEYMKGQGDYRCGQTRQTVRQGIFANGAITAAFGQAYNGEQQAKMAERRKITLLIGGGGSFVVGYGGEARRRSASNSG